MSECRNCGRGGTWNNDEFICEVCGATNHTDGSVSYVGTREAVDEMERRIRDYDDWEYERGR